MTARESEEPIAFATLSEVEGHCSLSIGPGLGGDGEAECGSEGTNDVDEWVQVTDGSEKPRTDLARVCGFAEVDVDVGDLIVFEKG